jgi:mycothiol synthase
MKKSIYTIRNYRPKDFDKYIGLIIDAQRLEPEGVFDSPEAIGENLYRPNYSPERDLFIVETTDGIVGYAGIELERLIWRVVLDCYIRPDHRRRGLARKLLGYATHRARELGVELVHVNIVQSNLTARSVLSRLGFSFVRRFLQLKLEMARIDGLDIDQMTLSYRHFQRGEEDKLTQIQNCCFTGSWGFNPNSLEEISYYTNLSRCSPADVVLACDGNEVIGYCWTKKIYETGVNEGKGQIFMLGVDPDYRGRGVGKAVLLAGLLYLKEEGFQVAELTVDSENQAACFLYSSVGFEVVDSTLWYETKIN